MRGQTEGAGHPQPSPAIVTSVHLPPLLFQMPSFSLEVQRFIQHCVMASCVLLSPAKVDVALLLSSSPSTDAGNEAAKLVG